MYSGGNTRIWAGRPGTRENPGNMRNGSFHVPQAEAAARSLRIVLVPGPSDKPLSHSV